MPNGTRQDRVAENLFGLVLRLQQFPNGNPSDAAAARGRAHVLIKDILRIRLDVEAEPGGESYVHARGFSDVGKALAASRALQLAFEGFRAALPAGRTNVSVVLDSLAPEEVTARTGFPVGQKDLLDLTKPSQVLMTQAVYEKIAPSQPLALRSFPDRSGIYEFLWTTEERLDALRAAIESVPKLVVEPVSAHDSEKTIVSRPIADATKLPPREQVRPAAAPWNPRVPVDREADPPPRSRRKIFAMGGTAAVLILACCLIVWRAYVGSRSNVEVRTSPPIHQQPASTQVPPLKPPASPQPSVIQTPPQGLSRSVTDSSPKSRPSRPLADPDVDKKAITRPCDISIPDYLRYAESNRNRGEYDRAKDEYAQVLACEPNNHEARQGLQRAKDDERLSETQ